MISLDPQVVLTWLRAGSAAVALLSLSSCSGAAVVAHAASSSPPPTLRASAPSRTPTTQPPSLSPSLTPSVKPSASLAVRPAKACTAHQLTVSLGYLGAAAGTWSAAVRFHNIGATTCSLRGYPRVIAFDHPRHIAAYGFRLAAGYMGRAVAVVKTINVPPDAFASAMLEGGDNPVGDATTCADYPILEVAPPNTDTFIRLNLSGTLSGSVPGTLSGCTGIFVHSIVAGAEGFNTTP